MSTSNKSNKNNGKREPAKKTGFRAKMRGFAKKHPFMSFLAVTGVLGATGYMIGTRIR